MTDTSESEIDIETEIPISYLKLPKPAFANVRFEDEKTKIYQVPIKDIRRKVIGKDGEALRIPFEPKNNIDFNPKLLYRVRWYCPKDCLESHDNHYTYYAATILHLGESEDDCIKKLESNRCHFPKVLSDISEETLSSSGNQTEQLCNLDSKQELKKKAERTTASNIIKKNEAMKVLMQKRKRLDENIDSLKRKKMDEHSYEAENVTKKKPIIRNITNILPVIPVNELRTSNQSRLPPPSSEKENQFTDKRAALLSSDHEFRDKEKENFVAAFNFIKQSVRNEQSPSHYNTDNDDITNDAENRTSQIAEPNCEDQNYSYPTVSRNKQTNASHYNTDNDDITNDTENRTSQIAEPNCEDQNYSYPTVSRNKQTNGLLEKNIDIADLANEIQISHKRRPDKCQYTLPPDKICLIKNGLQIYDKVNEENQVYLGLDIFCDTDVWAKMKSRKKKPTIFLRELATVIWQPHELVMRAFDVRSCTAVTPGIESSRLPFEEDKWQLLIALYTDYLNELKKKNPSVDVDVFLNGVNDIIAQKIQDLRSKLRRLEREKYYDIHCPKRVATKAVRYIKHHHRNE